MKGDERVQLLEESFQFFLLSPFWKSDLALLPILNIKN